MYSIYLLKLSTGKKLFKNKSNTKLNLTTRRACQDLNILIRQIKL